MFALVMLVAMSLALVQATPAGPPAALDYRGTVQAIVGRPPAVDLLTGVGFALRTVSLRTQPTTAVDSAGVSIPLARLQVGDVVRAECHRVDGVVVVDRIELQAPAGAGGAR